MQEVRLEILPDHKTGTIAPGETLLEAIRKIDGIQFETPCNGRGTCGKCRIILKEGELTELTSGELKRITGQDLRAGYRLACLTKPAEGCEKIVIEIPGREKQAVVLADAEYDARVKAPLFETGGAPYAIAVDIGTTTIAAVLISMDNGETLARSSMINPQTVIGGDVLSRIAHTMKDDGDLDTEKLGNLQKLVVDGLNTLSRELLEQAGRTADEISGVAVAANCTMLHLLLAVDPRSIARAPFTPVFKAGQTLPAHEIGLLPENPRAMLYCLPSISAYIGADIVAGIYMSGIYKTDRNIMFIDIGTNGEIVCSKGGKMYACSCAAGPAMEGMNITCGMRAAEGAVQSVWYEDGEVAYDVIGGEGTMPIGICGSGVLETAAMLLATHSIKPSGKVDPTYSMIADRYFKFGKSTGYYLNRSEGRDNIYFNQSDVRQIQLAKGAIYSGFCALIETAGISFDELDEVLIAGQFGSHLKAETLADIGIIPSQAREKVRYIGNSSLSGAVSVLLDKDLAKTYEELSDQVEYMELATYPGYDRLLMQCMKFPDYT